MNANSRIRFGLKIVFVYLYITPSHYHHCANLSKDIELMKCLSDIFLSCVWVGQGTFSQLSIIQYVGLCVFNLPISPVMIKRIYILCLIIIIIKSEVWTITHCLGLGHETMVYAVCLSVFFWNHIRYKTSHAPKLTSQWQLDVGYLFPGFHRKLGSSTTVRCAKFLDDFTTEINVMDKPDFTESNLKHAHWLIKEEVHWMGYYTI